jgi:hypothetical protein
MPASPQFGLAVESVRALLRALPLCPRRAPLGSRPVPPDLAISLTFANDPGGRICPRRAGLADANVFGRFVETVTGQPGRVVVSDFEQLTHLRRFDQVHRVLAGRLR